MNSFLKSFIRILVVFAIVVGFVEFTLGTGQGFVSLSNSMVMLFLLFVLLVLIAFEIVIHAVERMLLYNLSEEKRKAYLDNKKAKSFSRKCTLLLKRFFGSRESKSENEIIIDHNYDGIKELDNALPPWWIYSFYISIIFAAVYLLRYHVFDGPNPIQELEMANIKAEKDIALYRETAKDFVNAETAEVLTDPADLNQGKNIFTSNCVACHLADGGGSIGPNLTDNYWINGGGSINNIFEVISEGGRDGKGMIAWNTLLKPSEIAQVSSYVYTLIGTTPATPKDAEGELWIPDSVEQ